MDSPLGDDVMQDIIDGMAAVEAAEAARTAAAAIAAAAAAAALINNNPIGAAVAVPAPPAPPRVNVGAQVVIPVPPAAPVAVIPMAPALLAIPVDNSFDRYVAQQALVNPGVKAFPQMVMQIHANAVRTGIPPLTSVDTTAMKVWVNSMITHNRNNPHDNLFDASEKIKAQIHKDIISTFNAVILRARSTMRADPVVTLELKVSLGKSCRLFSALEPEELVSVIKYLTQTEQVTIAQATEAALKTVPLPANPDIEGMFKFLMDLFWVVSEVTLRYAMDSHPNAPLVKLLFEYAFGEKIFTKLINTQYVPTGYPLKPAGLAFDKYVGISDFDFVRDWLSSLQEKCSRNREYFKRGDSDSNFIRVKLLSFYMTSGRRQGGTANAPTASSSSSSTTTSVNAFPRSAAAKPKEGRHSGKKESPKASPSFVGAGAGGGSSLAAKITLDPKSEVYTYEKDGKHIWKNHEGIPECEKCMGRGHNKPACLYPALPAGASICRFCRNAASPAVNFHHAQDTCAVAIAHAKFMVEKRKDNPAKRPKH